MRIGLLLLAAGRKAGGPETYEVQLVHALARLAPETDFFIYVTNEEARAAIGIEQSNLHYRLLRPENRWIALSWGIRRRMQQDAIQLLHCTYAPPLFGARYIFTMHCVSNLVHPGFYGRYKSARLNFLQLRGLRRAQEILCVSGFVRQQLSARFGVSAARSSVVHNGIDPAFSPSPDLGARLRLRDRYGIRKPYLLYVGKLQRRKNIARLVEAYTSFRNREGVDMHLVMAGRPTETDQAANIAIQRSGFADDILQIGYVPPPTADSASLLPDLYRCAHMFVLPSLFEGFGLPVVESMACGTPVLCSNDTSLPEIAADAALLVNPLSVQEISAGMSQLHHSAELRALLVRRGLERARCFTWDQCARQTLASYRRALGAQDAALVTPCVPKRAPAAERRTTPS